MKSASERFNQVIMTVLTVAMSMIAIALWTEPPRFSGMAHAAGIPDSGSQLQEIVDEVKAIRTVVSQNATLLKSGKVKVQVVVPTADPADPTDPADTTGN